MCKVLITGASGQVGYRLKELICSDYVVLSPSRKEFDLLNLKSIKRFISKEKPDFIVNCAAYTNVDLAEKELEICKEVNSEAVLEIAKISAKHKTPLIHLSTDFVFDGLCESEYTEESQTNPINHYGYTKLLGERNIINNHSEYIILRTSSVFDKDRGNNFFLKMLELYQTQTEVKVVCDLYSKPTSANFLAERIRDVLNKLVSTVDRKDLWGIYNICEYPKMTWFDFAMKILEENKNLLKNKKISIVPVKSSEWNFIAKRPANSSLNIEKFKVTFPY